jgi:hypothetical protein
LAYILVTPPTSGTAALQRIVKTIAGDKIAIKRLGKPAFDRPVQAGEEGTFIDPDSRIIWWFQGPRYWNPQIDLSRYELIVHFRDPRDLACNQYWWALQHPNTKDPPEEAERKRKRVEDGGIEKYVLGRNNFASYQMLMDVSESPVGDSAVYTSYAQLCCAFDLMVRNLCGVFKRSQADVAEALQIERPENLFANPDWVKVGGTWKGADVSPGRFRRDLTPEGRRKMTEKWANELAFCRKREVDFLVHHYL